VNSPEIAATLSSNFTYFSRPMTLSSRKHLCSNLEKIMTHNKKTYKSFYYNLSRINKKIKSFKINKITIKDSLLRYQDSLCASQEAFRPNETALHG
ncbi:hypothetical protein K4G95_21220, partial [Mycobacterium tuberculosis]|nr:hypothetical protein [Mycobacterium tuberculosis]